MTASHARSAGEYSYAVPAYLLILQQAGTTLPRVTWGGLGGVVYIAYPNRTRSRCSPSINLVRHLVNTNYKHQLHTMFQLSHALLLFGAAALVAADTGYIDCVPGTLNVILSAPHGGNDTPSAIPDRDYGCDSSGDCVWTHSCGTKDTTNCVAKVSKDLYTWELALAVRDELHTLTGKYPHLVVNKLHRKKLDANRAKDEGAFGHSVAEEAWDEYHGCITDARDAIDGTGLLIDLHGYYSSSSTPWVLLGYLITKTRLNTNTIVAGYTSIKAMNLRNSGDSIEDIVKGSDSFGAYMETYGYSAMPSDTNTSPGTSKYYSGGYITRYYGSRYSGDIDAIQIESPQTFRALPNGDYAQAIANAINDYIDRYY